LEGDGEALGAEGQVIAAVDVEEPDPFEEFAGGVLDGEFDAAEGDFFADDEADVSADGRVAVEDGLDGFVAVGFVEQFEVDFGEEGGRMEAGLFGEIGVYLPEETARDGGLAGGVEARIGGRRCGRSECAADAGVQVLEMALESEKVSGDGFAASP